MQAHHHPAPSSDGTLLNSPDSRTWEKFVHSSSMRTQSSGVMLTGAFSSPLVVREQRIPQPLRIRIVVTGSLKQHASRVPREIEE
jgi:hypothetical protein